MNRESLWLCPASVAIIESSRLSEKLLSSKTGLTAIEQTPAIRFWPLHAKRSTHTHTLTLNHHQEKSV